MAIGGFGKDEEVLADDPLARLESEMAFQPAPADAPLPEIDRRTLTFPEVLAPSDERPEVAAALAAAAAELAHPDPLDDGRPPLALDTIPAGLPAALAADTSAASLARTAARDPLMAAALPDAPSAPPAEPGRDGAYTVQVISYDSPEGAEAFAAALRARGHRAFVTTAQVEGRGTVYRVRIGPFETKREAQAYRREFERTERMNTLVVRRRDA
jgi:cell division septation protein DedD